MVKIVDYLDILPPDPPPASWEATKALMEELRALCKKYEFRIRIPRVTLTPTKP